MSNEPLKNKVALVTGASRGIGAAIARRLAREGARVAITYSSSPEKAEEVSSQITAAGGHALSIKADSVNANEIEAAVAQVAKAYGRLDILVNNAGVAVMGPIDNLTLADFDRTFAINVRAAFVAIQAALKHMGEGGRIINVGSCNAERAGFPGVSIYSASKAALVGLAKGLSRDLGPRGITVNNLHPGPIDTDMNPQGSDFAKVLKSQFLSMPRYGSGDEIGAFVAFLAGPEAAFITGANLEIDGGFTA